jgi:hypothetical protein
MKRSGYGVPQLRDIYLFEVAPVVFANLLSVSSIKQSRPSTKRMAACSIVGTAQRVLLESQRLMPIRFSRRSLNPKGTLSHPGAMGFGLSPLADCP